MKIGDCVFDGSTYVMSIINLTPDSFYDKSRATDGFKSAVDKHISDGADILDIGAQSTRPGYTEVGADEEIKRLEPLLIHGCFRYKSLVNDPQLFIYIAAVQLIPCKRLHLIPVMGIDLACFVLVCDQI